MWGCRLGGEHHTCLPPHYTPTYLPPPMPVPQNHVSFVPQHEQAGMQLGDIAATPSKKHFFRLFNPHCVAGTPGADFAGAAAF